MDANTMAGLFRLKYDGAGFAQRTFTDREVSTWLSQGQASLTKSRLDPLKNRTQRGPGQSPRDAELSGILAAHTTFTAAGHDFMKGTPDNGAYRTPDLDAQTDSTHAFGAYVKIPDECYWISSEVCEIERAGRVSRNVKVKGITPEMYNEQIYDRHFGPGYDLVWGMDFGSYTVAGTGSSETSEKYDGSGVLTGFTGVSIADDTTPVTIATDRCRLLIPGKDYNLYSYTLHYYKLPQDIRVNVRDSLDQINSELPAYMHEEIVAEAVTLAVASIIPAEAKYQVADKESKENE